MQKYILTILLLCLSNTAHAGMIDNEEALQIVYDTKIAGIGLNSSAEDIKSALSQHQTPMECDYRENTVTSQTRMNQGKKKVYQEWNCKYVEGMKHKMLNVHVINGTVYSILYRGSVTTSLDAKDMFSYYRDINAKLLATGIEHNDYSFVFKDMKADVSPQLVEQSLTTKLQEQCKGMPSPVSFQGDLTHMIAKDAFTIEVKYERKSCA
ncbi:MAG: hypothetical protein ACRBDL_01500 [Alphaproteobacteria bacterium]